MTNLSSKIKILAFLMCVITLISTVNTTYSRYVSASEGVVTTNLARWQIFINSQNVTENYGSSITFNPIIEPNEHVAANKIAPSSKGYFDIAIDPTNVDVSFTYDITFNIPEDSIITDIKVTDYVIVEGNEITEESSLTKISVDNNTLSDVSYYDNTKPFSPFVIRVYFSWIDNENETMNDVSDSNIGNMIANGEITNFELGVNINFKQYVGEILDEEDETQNNIEPIDDVNLDDGDEIIDDANFNNGDEIVPDDDNIE